MMLLKIRRIEQLLLNTLNIVLNRCLFSLSSKLDYSREFSTADDRIE